MRIIIYILVLLQVLISCNIEPKKLKFIPIKVHFYNDTLKKTISQSYIIRNFTNNERDFRSIDSFFCTTMYNEFDDRSSVGMIFYKESRYTNLKEIEKYDHIIDQYSVDHDYIYTLELRKNHNHEVWKYKTFDGVEQRIGSFKCK